MYQTGLSGIARAKIILKYFSRLDD